MKSLIEIREWQHKCLCILLLRQLITLLWLHTPLESSHFYTFFYWRTHFAKPSGEFPIKICYTMETSDLYNVVRHAPFQKWLHFLNIHTQFVLDSMIPIYTSSLNNSHLFKLMCNWSFLNTSNSGLRCSRSFSMLLL